MRQQRHRNAAIKAHTLDDTRIRRVGQTEAVVLRGDLQAKQAELLFYF